MFRSDRVTIKRDVYELVQGEVVHEDQLLVAEDVPCHLSVILNNTFDIKGAPCIVSDFTLFVNSNVKNIKENDVLSIETKSGQTYKLYAGEIKIYNLTTQIKCRQEKIIES